MLEDKSHSPKVYEISPTLKFLSSCLPIPGYEDFIGTYLFCGEKKALVDVGPKAAIPGLLLALSQVGVSPDEIDYIILSHIHIDHAGGVGTAVREMNNARVLVHSRGRAHLIDPTALWKSSQETLGKAALKYGSYDPVPGDRIILAEEGMKLDLGQGLILEIYLTPGHAAHHLIVFNRASGILLAGDSAGVYTNGFLRLTTPPQFRLDDYMASLDKMIALRPVKLGYAHFGCYDNAIERLHAIREKVFLWHKIAQSAVREGKTAEEIIQLIRAKDKTLDRLDTLDKDTYGREYLLLLNSVQGLMTAK
ncbi:MAG: MBL fold metallo-hydrolase [Chloroflexi bacterium]|nr:MBL fold metallo-hydrolase [Chloroflexota bacterium]